MIYKDIYKQGTDPADGSLTTKLMRLGYDSNTLYVYEVLVVDEKEELKQGNEKPKKI